VSSRCSRAARPSRRLSDERLDLERRRAHRAEQQVLVRQSRSSALRSTSRSSRSSIRSPTATPGRRRSARSRARSCRPWRRRGGLVRPSRATWYGMITWALRLTRTRETSIPRGAACPARDQRRRVDHDAVADDRRDVRVQHARRHEWSFRTSSP
jgi:hypothetical protein